MPKKYQFGTRDGMNEILSLLGIKTKPDLTFSFTKNRGFVVPPRETHHETFARLPNPVKKNLLEEEDSHVKRSREKIAMTGPIPFDGFEHSSGTGEEDKPSGILPTYNVHAVEEDSIHVITPKECKVNSSLKCSIPTRGDSQNSESLDEPDTILSTSDKQSVSAIPSQKIEDSSSTKSDGKNENEEKVITDPNVDDKDHNKYILTDLLVTNILTAIAEFQNTLFLICEPSANNDFARLACEVAAEFHNTTNTLGLFDIDHTEKNGGTLFYEGNDSKKRIDIAKHTMARGEDLSLLTSPMKSNCGEKDGEKNEDKNAGGLASKVSHRLIFATKKEKEEFQLAFRVYNPTGHFACGATEDEMKTVVNAFKKGLPLFIIEGTGPVADYAKQFKEKNDTGRDSAETLRERKKKE